MKKLKCVVKGSLYIGGQQKYLMGNNIWSKAQVKEWASLVKGEENSYPYEGKGSRV